METGEEMLDAARIILGEAPSHNTVQLIKTSAGEWAQRWVCISSARLPGPTRSLLWRIMHRRLPLLSQPWIANHYQRTPHCLLCEHQVRESYSHLFSDCVFATGMWRGIRPILDCFHVPAHPDFDLRPAQLIGDINGFDLGWIRTLGWGGDSPTSAQHLPAVPSYNTQRRLLRHAWTEIRGTVIRAIWLARCDVLHANVQSVHEAKNQAHFQIHSSLRALLYTKTVTPLAGAFKSISPVVDFFHLKTWGSLAPSLLLQHHR